MSQEKRERICDKQKWLKEVRVKGSDCNCCKKYTIYFIIEKKNSVICTVNGGRPKMAFGV